MLINRIKKSIFENKSLERRNSKIQIFDEEPPVNESDIAEVKKTNNNNYMNFLKDGNKNFKKGCFNENIRRELITD